MLNKSQILAKEIDSETTRLDKIDHQIEIKTTQKNELEQRSSELKSQISTREALLHEAGKQNEAAIANANKAISQKEIDAALSQRQNSEQMIEKLNDEIFSLMEEEEKLDEELQSIRTFLQGVKEGREEIVTDIEEINAPKLEELNRYRKRVNELYPQIPDPHREHFQNLVKKNLPKGPITRLDQKNFCELCGTQASSTKVKSIEEQLQYGTCSSCSRVIIPESSQYL